MTLTERMSIRRKIIILLKASRRPLSLSEIVIYLGDSFILINLSLAELLREGEVEIESKESGNFFSRVSEDYPYSPELIGNVMTLN